MEYKLDFPTIPYSHAAADDSDTFLGLIILLSMRCDRASKPTSREGCRVQRMKAASRASQGLNMSSSMLKMPRVGVWITILNLSLRELIPCRSIWTFPDLCRSTSSGGPFILSHQMTCMTATPSHIA